MTRILLALVALVLLAGCGGDVDSFARPTATATPSPTTVPPTPTPGPPIDLLLVLADSNASNLTLLDPETGNVQGRIEVGRSPWRIATAGTVAYVTTARELTIVEVTRGTLIGRLPLQSKFSSEPSAGEYREGGMGVALSPDGQRAYVGVYTNTGSFLEVFHTRQGFERAVPIGGRPFDVVVDASGRTVYSIDHDTFTLTAVDTETWESRTVEIAPLGTGPYDKPHYGTVVNGELLMPYQGRTLLAYNLETGARREIPLTANTHQHGITLNNDGTIVAIVGSGPAGEATAGPSLTVLTLADGTERVIPLSRPHELVAIAPDGKTAYLTGGYLLEGGWEGITVVDLGSGATREVVTPGRPIGILVMSRGPGG